MSSQTLYDLLAVPADADFNTIRASYRRLTRTYHPDVAGDAGTVMMQKINEAWDTLRDETRRRAYDSTLPNGPGTSGEKPAPNDQTTAEETQADTGDDFYVDPDYAGMYITDRDGRLAYDPRAHRIWEVTRRIALTIMAAGTLFFIVSIQFLTYDLAGQAPLRAFAVPSLLVFGLMTFGTHGTTAWNFPFRAAFVLFCLTGPLAVTQLIPFIFIAPNFHWWESVTAVTLLAAMLVHKRAKKMVGRYRATWSLIP